MTEPPETFHNTATPVELLQRLDFVREQYRMGVLSASDFNDCLKLFQFKDDQGTLWTPGARSNQWFRRQNEQWIAASPPDELQIPPMSLVSLAEPDSPGQDADGAELEIAVGHAAERRCPVCDAVVPAGRRFCTNDGTRIPD